MVAKSALMLLAASQRLLAVLLAAQVPEALLSLTDAGSRADGSHGTGNSLGMTRASGKAATAGATASSTTGSGVDGTGKKASLMDQLHPRRMPAMMERLAL